DDAVAAAAADSRSFVERLRSRDAWIIPARKDPRWIFCVFHSSYVLAGHLLLNFNRSPAQIITALVSCMLLELIYTYVSTRMFIIPLSGIISGLGLGLLF